MNTYDFLKLLEKDGCKKINLYGIGVYRFDESDIVKDRDGNIIAVSSSASVSNILGEVYFDSKDKAIEFAENTHSIIKANFGDKIKRWMNLPFSNPNQKEPTLLCLIDETEEYHTSYKYMGMVLVTIRAYIKKER